MILKLKKPSIFFLLALVTYLVGCDTENEGPVSLLNVVVDASYNTAEDDHWIILHNAAGEILAVKSFENNETFALRSELAVTENTIGVTLVQRHSTSGPNVFSINSYLSVEKGRTLTIRSHQFTPGDFTGGGSFNIEVDGAVNTDQATVSDNLGSYSVGYNNLNLMFQGDYYGLPKKLVQFTDPDGNLKYKMLENTKPNDFYALKLEDFSCVENVVKFNFPESNRVYLNIFGRELNQTWNDRGFMINQHYKGDKHTTIKAGYYSWLDRYETYLTVFYPDYGLVYGNIGGVPGPTIAWPAKSDFSISNSSIDNFSTTANVPYVYQFSIWQYSNPTVGSVSWYISNPSSGHVFKELPEELVTQYPELSFENMKLINTTFYTEAEPYENYIEKNISAAKETTPQSVGIIISN